MSNGGCPRCAGAMIKGDDSGEGGGPYIHCAACGYEPPSEAALAAQAKLMQGTELAIEPAVRWSRMSHKGEQVGRNVMPHKLTAVDSLHFNGKANEVMRMSSDVRQVSVAPISRTEELSTQDAIDALTALGYKHREAKEAVELTSADLPVEERIRAALLGLAKQQPSRPAQLSQPEIKVQKVPDTSPLPPVRKNHYPLHRKPPRHNANQGGIRSAEHMGKFQKGAKEALKKRWAKNRRTFKEIDEGVPLKPIKESELALNKDKLPQQEAPVRLTGRQERHAMVISWVKELEAERKDLAAQLSQVDAVLEPLHTLLACYDESKVAVGIEMIPQPRLPAPAAEHKNGGGSTTPQKRTGPQNGPMTLILLDVLRDAGKPLHKKELHQLAVKRGWQPMPGSKTSGVELIYANLKANAGVVLTAPSTFALK